MYLEKDNYVHHFTSLKKELYISEFGHKRCKNSEKINPYMRNVFIIHFTVNGKLDFCSTSVEKGQGFLISAKKVHSMNFFGENNEQFWIGFDGELARQLIEKRGFTSDKHGIFNIRCFPYVEKILKTAFEECGKENSEEIALSTLLSLLPFIEVKKEEPEEYGYFETAVSLMKRNHYRSISMNSIAAKINISEKHLCRLFKQKCGLSPKQYMTKIRMEAAKKMLMESDLRVKEIAQIEGYSSQGAFSQAFANYYGKSPSDMKANKS